MFTIYGPQGQYTTARSNTALTGDNIFTFEISGIYARCEAEEFHGGYYARFLCRS